jgi:hypothetical protein
VNLSRLFIAGILALSASIAVRADGIPTDGQVVVGHGTDPVPTDTPCHLTGPNINVNLSNGGGVLNCFNATGQDWTGLDITAEIPLSDVANCSPKMGSGFTCGMPMYTPLGNSDKVSKKKVEIILTGYIPSSPSLTMPTFLSEFFLNFDNSGNSPTGPGGWLGADGGSKDEGSNHGIVKVRPIVSTPEPSVAILVLVGGLGVLCFYRRS